MATVKLKRKTAHTIYKAKDGSVLPGSSTVAKIGDDCGQLLNWANNLGLRGIDHNKEREEAADAGQVCHFMIQCYLQGNTPDLSEFSGKVIKLATIGYKKFLKWWEQEDLSLIACEVPLVSELYRYGGTLDIIAKDKKDRIWLTDQKTSKQIYLSHLSQVSSYEQLWNENHPEQKIEAPPCIVRIDRKLTTDFEVRPVYCTEKYFNYFKAQLALYRAKKAL
jgi:hypothetical protein